GLDLGEGHLDRVEVRTVRREEQHDGPRGLDGLPDAGGLVGRQVVKDDDVAWPEDRGQDLLDISEEGGPGHRSIDGHGRYYAVEGEAADEGRCLPMAVRHRGSATLAPERAAVHSRHLGRGPAFVDEDEALGVEVGLRLEPGAPPARYVRPALLGGV